MISIIIQDFLELESFLSKFLGCFVHGLKSRGPEKGPS